MISKLKVLLRQTTRGDAVLLTSVIQQAALLASGVGSAWLIGDSGRGQLAYGMTVGSIAGLIATGGWSPAAAMALAGRWGPSDTVLDLLRRVALRRALLAILLAIVVMVPFFDKLATVLVPVTCGAIASSVGLVALQFVVGVAQGRGLAGRANLLKSGISVCYAAPIVVLAELHFIAGTPVSVATVAWAWTASWGIPVAIGLVLMWRFARRSPKRSEPEPSLVRRMKSYSRASFLSSVSVYELLRADQLVGIIVLGTSELGQYVVAASFTGLVKAIGQASGVSILSAAARSDRVTNLGNQLRRSLVLICLAGALTCVGLWPVFHWVLPVEFETSLYAAIILAGASTVSAFRRVLVEYAKGADRPIGGSVAEVVFSVILVSLIAGSIVPHSATGLALATLAGCGGALAVAVISAEGARRALAQRARSVPLVGPRPSGGDASVK